MARHLRFTNAMGTTRLVKAGHVLALIGTTYFLIATSAEPVPVSICFSGVEDRELFRITLDQHLTGSINATEGLDGGLAGAVDGGTSAPVEVGCAGLDGLDTLAEIELRLHDLSLVQPDMWDGAACFNFRAEPTGDFPMGFNAEFDDQQTSPGLELATATASLSRPSTPGCEGSWSLELVPEEREGVIDPSAPPDGSALRWLLRRELTIDQVHFCDGFVDPAIRGRFSCEDTWVVTISEAP